MKALSLHQPWASLLALGVKTIETRSWPCPPAYIGQRIAIAATAGVTHTPKGRMPIGEFEIERDASGLLLRSERLSWPYRLPLGCIVATAIVAECLPMVMPSQRDTTDHIGVWNDREGEGAILFRFPSVGSQDCYPSIDLHDQYPYGDYRPGRWAWMLTDIERVRDEPPFKGGQGLTREWTP